MQKSIRANEHQLYYLVNKARENGLAKLSGNLWKRSLDTGKWQLRYFILYQNLLFYFDGERIERPSGVIFLESSYCEPNVNLKSGRDDKTSGQQGNYFTISYRKEGVRQYDLRADTEEECSMWVDAINGASFSKLLELKQEAEQKQLHLSQILETEQRAKWHYVKQIEELTAEIKQLKYEFNEYRIDRRFNLELESESEELRKIKKVQSFFRGWLCRRRWKQIVEEYIRSDHAESMRRRNSIVFGLVECEDEYVQQLSILVTCYLRPFRMAASSKKPIVSHEDVNSIFLNAEAVLFLHQVFVQGLRNKMENWPTLQLGDLFDLLLPMLGIYQEYVRNHHYSLQVLAEYKQRPEFTHMLKRLEEKPLCEGRSIESFLTYPMHQIPRYIITLHELLAHTPYDHVDRKKLEFATSKLEQISHIMHDEVSETENIRKNLAIERMIVDGCDLLLDVNQVFVRQGTLIQVICDKLRSSRSRLGNFGSSYRERKEAVRQVFLFTNHLLITARTNNGKLRLVKNCGKISLVECTLVEDTTAELFNMDDEDQLNVTNEQKCQQDNTSQMTKNNTVQLLSTTPLNVNTNVELNTRNSISVSTLGTNSTTNTTTTSSNISMTTHELGQQLPQNLNKRFICPDSTPNRYTYVNKSNQMDSISKSTTITGTVQQQSIPYLSTQHRHSTSLCIGTNINNNENDLHDSVTNCSIIPISSTDIYSTSISTIDEARAVSVTTVTTMTTANIITTTTMTSTMNSTNTSSSSILNGRNNSNVSYSTITSPTITTIITPDINIMNSSSVLPSSSCIQPTSLLSFSMLHRFSSNMGLFNSINNNNNNNNNTCNNDKTDYGNLDFRLIWEPKNGQPTSIWLVASTLQEKAAWCSDISQCIEQLHYGDILNSAQSDVSSVAMPQSIRSDPKLFKDDVDIKFSHTLNSCKVPQIRYATVSRLLDRLTDARFLSIDFLNTFLLTYRVFTTGLSVIWALNQVLANPDVENGGNTPHSNQNQSFTYSHFENSEQRDRLYTARPSEVSLTINRLPVLEESAHSITDDISSSLNSISQTEGRLETNNSSMINSISNELMTTLSLNKEDSSINTETPLNSFILPTTMNCTNNNVSMKLPKKLIPRPLSTSETVKYCSPSITSNQDYNTPNVMSQSVINESHSLSSSPLSYNKQSNKQIMSRSFQSSTIVTIPIQTTSTTMLIPRSPVYSKFVDLRDDPPLELPILPDLKTTEKKQKQTEFKQKVDNVTSPNSTDQKESMNTIKEHTRLAPLASCEVVPDESETTSLKQELFNNKQISVSTGNNVNNTNHNDNKYEPDPSENNSVNPNLHSITCNHLDNRLNQSKSLLNQENQPKPDHVVMTKQEGIKTSERYKHNLSEDISKSDVVISISCENQPTEHFKYPPTEEIVAKDVTKTNEKSFDRLTKLTSQQQSNFLHWPSNNLIHSSSNNNNHNSHYSKLSKSPSSLHYSNDNNRLLESYLNQTIGSSLLSTEINTDRIQSRRSFDKIPEDNIQQQVPLESQKQSNDTTELHHNSTSNIQTCNKQSTVILKSSSLSINNNNNTTKYYPVADSLDLATRLTVLKKSPKSFTACQSLAKHTMIAALNCSGAFAHLKTTPITTTQYQTQQLSNDNNTTQLKYLDNDIEYKNIIIRSSPSSPKKYSTEICSDIKNAKQCVNIRGASEERENTDMDSFKTVKNVSTKSAGVLEASTNAKQSIQSQYKQAGIVNLNQTTNEPRQTIRKIKGKEIDHSDENKPSLETINSLSSSNIQRISDIMLRDRNDSLIPQHLGIIDCARGSVVSWSGVSNVSKPKRPSVFSCPEAEIESPRSSVVNPSLGELASNKRTRPGAVVTSSRRSKRRSSNTAAAQAFAVATAGSANPLAAVGIMGLGPNLFRSSGYRFSAGTATSVASQTGLRLGPTPHSNPSIGNITNNSSSSIINSGSNSSSNIISPVFINRSQVQNTSGYTYPLSPGISNKVMSPTTMGTNGTVVATTLMTSSMVSTTPTSNTTFRLNLNRSGLNIITTSTPGTITNTNSTSNNNTFNFHPYNLTSPTLIQSSCLGVGTNTGHCTNQAKRNTMLATASCLRVLNVVRHWITKFPDDFESDPVLKREMLTLLDTLITCPHLMPNDQKVVNQLLLQMISDQLVQDRIDLDSILTPRQIPSEKNFDQLSALDISEQLTFLDFQIFRSIRSEELLNQSWMKLDKEEKAKHVLLVCKRFNEVSRLVVSEIISRTDLNDRVMCIDKWVAIADICRCMQNYNGVLQICSALVNSSVYRLKRTWERVSKQTKQSIDRLQMLVASDGRFKSMREALHRCDPPCIPYLGMYLTDLSFIEEGALNITENNLVNFCKMRMIAHVIREVQQYHQTPYLITHRQEVTDYLLDPSRLLDEEQTYQASLTIEPRQSINRQSLSGFT